MYAENDTDSGIMKFIKYVCIAFCAILAFNSCSVFKSFKSTAKQKQTKEQKLQAKEQKKRDKEAQKLRIASICPRCHGTGKCQACGVIYEYNNPVPVYMRNADPECKKCHGSGACDRCGGTGHIKPKVKATKEKNTDKDTKSEKKTKKETK